LLIGFCRKWCVHSKSGAVNNGPSAAAASDFFSRATRLLSRFCKEPGASRAGVCGFGRAGSFSGSTFTSERKCPFGQRVGRRQPGRSIRNTRPKISLETLEESLTFLTIEQAYVVHEDYRWVVAENGIPFNHYWRDYKQSLNAWIHSGWNDGDPNLYGYVGHPIQGAMTAYIQIQNDPRSEYLEFSNTKQYWRSRLKATIWNAVYSTQWNIGPISEMTVEKYGAKARPPWNQDGSWPCTTKNCYTGVGQIDLVMTPIGGLGWLVGEDWLDKNLVRRVENKTRNRIIVDTVRCAFNPIRSGANILHGNKPWYRLSRDSRMVEIEHHVTGSGSAPAAAPRP